MGDPGQAGGAGNVGGFSLHAGVAVRANQRNKRERLCRYITRPAIVNERLKRNRAGQLALQLKSAYRDGTTNIVIIVRRLERVVSRWGD